ncbi:MAG: hypothetical protein BalsKO_29900 [Balneolaceae bacterium]
MIRKHSFIALVIILGIFISCDNDGITITEIEKLDDAIERWESNKSKDYSFIYEEQCFCPYFGKVEVIVFADTIFALKNPETGEDFTIETGNGEEKLIDVYPDYVINIDELFVTLKEASLKADEMEGSYDGQIGYPKEVSIDYYKDAVDDEITYLISNYQVLSLTNN